MEMHSPDIAPHLFAEQGWSYYLQVYLSVGIFVLGLVMGLYLGQRRRKISASTGHCD
ncbi:hypothetical protein SAMN05192589_10294 [Paracidovorax valerianellae]|uniref:Uncharacterized protein n=1 Tax=Paracidovorax valerianellae TaxID=187868 RepID=A0A1G6LA40_9BURK|nr:MULTISPECIES: hypothetical protein [Pseudomonadota]MEA9578729.1 hypothetical protein [Xanthomonas nasturtii]SDC39426.1 hypothetical protein SAMN05192589_10294 [Paracidovorax valerianellae]